MILGGDNVGFMVDKSFNFGAVVLSIFGIPLLIIINLIESVLPIYLIS